MKMTTVKVITVICLLVLFAGCVSTPKTPPPVFKIEIQSEKDSGIASIEALANWQNAALFTKAGISGFSLNIINNTEKIIRIVWEKSSLSYNGGSYAPFISGQKYTNASDPMAPTIVPAKGSMGKDVYSSGQPYYESGQYGGWRMNPIISNSVIIVICVESGEIEEYYTIEASY